MGYERAATLRDVARPRGRRRRPAGDAAELRCPPDLAEVATPLGIQSLSWTEDALAERAALAVVLTTGSALLGIEGRASIAALIRGAAGLVRVPKDGNRFWRVDGFQWGEQGERKLANDLSLIVSTSPDPATTTVMLFGSRADGDVTLSTRLDVRENRLVPPGRAWSRRSSRRRCG